MKVYNVGILPIWGSTVGTLVREYAKWKYDVPLSSNTPANKYSGQLLNTELNDNDFAILKSLQLTAKNTPSKVIFVDEDKQYDAHKVMSNVKKVANGLKEMGIKQGDKVAIMALPNEIELYESVFAIQALGAVPVLINFLNTPNIPYMFLKSDATTLIVGRHEKMQEGAEKLSKAGLLKNVVYVADTEPKTFMQSLFVPYSLLRDSQEEIPDEEIFHNMTSSYPALQLYTSGSEGRPKRMTYSYQMVNNLVKALDRFGINENDKVILPVPFYHLAGLLVFCGALNYKVPIVLSEVPTRRYPPSIPKAVENITSNNVTGLPGVPAILEPLLESALKNNNLLPSLRLIFSGAAPLTKNLLALVDELNQRREINGLSKIRLVNLYASTECGPISSNVDEITPDKRSSVGFPFDNVEAKTSSSNELLIKVPVFPPEISEDLFTEEGFFKTGDTIDIVNGELIFRSRQTDRLNINGEKIAPDTIQNEINKFPGIKDSYVFGVSKNEGDGSDLICALVIPKNLTDESITQANIRKFLMDNELLPPTLIPRVIFVEPELPISLMGTTGKVTVKSLADKYGPIARSKYKRKLEGYRFGQAA